jgi:uncharacterized protein (UPF0276 family)
MGVMISREGATGTGIGLRTPHVGEIVGARPSLPWLEVHAENYMTGGRAMATLEKIRQEYPVSLHGVGLSLGTAGRLDARHLDRFRTLVEQIEPCLVSEHLAWSSVDGTYLNHLHPLPYTEETLRVFADHVLEVQEALGRRLLIENPSGYLRFRHSSIPEAEFIAEIVRRTGCGLLCDVNNIFVTAENLGLDPVGYLDTLPRDAVAEIHLAGHSRNDVAGHTILIDDHGSRVVEDVWRLYAHALRRFGPVPTLVEWDTDVPSLSVLLDEARRADDVREAVSREEACASPR